MKSIKILSLFLLLLCTPQIQTIIEAQIVVERCSVCGRPTNNCDYKGNHPKCKVCGKVKEKCPYQGNHPKCSTCGKYKDHCPYEGKHPVCSTCGVLKENCQYDGNHPVCSICGELQEDCKYNGNHPKCIVCGEVKEHCPYTGNHPVCSICGKYKENCLYHGNHTVCSTCGEYDVRCPYNGSHPVCSVCGKLLENCSYKGNHPVISHTTTDNGFIFSINDVSFNMIKVEGGTYTMGAINNQRNTTWYGGMKTHSVSVGTFYICDTEVTQALWQIVMGSIPPELSSSSYDLIGSSRPVCHVSWYDCQTFLIKLKSLIGINFRLPTEEEWEYAARGGNKPGHTKYSGSDSVDEVAWYTSNTSDRGTCDVKTKRPNELGIYDMSGNVCEWTSSYLSNHNNSSVDTYNYVYRGGCWYDDAVYVRVSCRDVNGPSYCNYYIGLRLALSPEDNLLF